MGSILSKILKSGTSILIIAGVVGILGYLFITQTEIGKIIGGVGEVLLNPISKSEEFFNNNPTLRYFSPIGMIEGIATGDVDLAADFRTFGDIIQEAWQNSIANPFNEKITQPSKEFFNDVGDFFHDDVGGFFQNDIPNFFHNLF